MKTRLASHPLRREIITSWVSNDLVNRGGMTFIFRAQEETGASPAEIVRAYTVIREIYQFERYWGAIDSLDSVVSTHEQATLYLRGRRLIDRGVRWLLQRRRTPIDVAAEIEYFAPVIDELTREIPGILVGSEKQRLLRRADSLHAENIPFDLALTSASLLLDCFALLDVVELAATTNRPAPEVAGLYFSLSEHFEVDRLLARVTSLPRSDRWSALARFALRDDLYSALAGLTSKVLTSSAHTRYCGERIALWEGQFAEGLSQAHETLHEVTAEADCNLAMLTVALRTLRALPG